MKTLLRYPGGKSRAIKKIIPHFPKDIEEMCSPFFGGGAIELEMLDRGIKVYGYDIFRPLVTFWSYAISNPKGVANLVKQIHPMSKEEFKIYQKILCNSNFQDITVASLFYAVNRSSFSGTTLSGGMSPNHPRFTESSIDRLLKFDGKNLSVEYAHFEESIDYHTNVKNTFKYCDPPYIIESNLYGVKGDTHKDFDHERLFRCLDESSNWILSYNDCEWVRSTYSNYKIVEIDFSYGMSKSKTELLIINT